MILFIEEYRPTKIKDIIGQNAGIAKIVDFLENFKSQKKHALIIYGPPGCGKTASVYVIANELNYEIIELTADDIRNKETIERIIGSAMNTGSIFGKKKIIFVDELESFSREDYGGLAALTNLIKISRIPVLLIALDIWDPKLSLIKSNCESVEFRKIHPFSIYKYLQSILSRERIGYDSEVIEFIAKNSDGDLRAALIDLSTILSGKEKLKKEDILQLEERPKETKIFAAVQQIFKSDSINTAMEYFEKTNIDFDTLCLWLNENITNEYKNSEEIAAAYDMASRSDVFAGRIIRRQDWTLQKYVINLEIAGISSAKKLFSKKFTRYQPPSKLIKLGRMKGIRNTINSIAAKVAQNTHSSSKIAKQTYIPMMRVIFRKNREDGQKIANKLNLEKDEIELLNPKELPESTCSIKF